MDSSSYYGMLSLRAAQRLKLPALEMNASSFLNKLYARENQMDSAYKYLTMADALKDSLSNQEKQRQVQNINFDEVLRERQLEEAKREAQRQYETKVKIYTLIAGLTVLLLIAFILYRNNRQKQNANLLLTQQKEKVESTLSELKATQIQLIQSEKMASLGELTAGIAHEIQNPLNFVNNFSEVNSELITEMKQEIEKGNLNDVKAIANDIDENEQKIIFHGKRADAIVKGMLQHSRSSTGIKEPTNINALADEYLRLAYHGLRAKDKSFNATMKTEYDDSIGNIYIIPQDIGRVILNLITNAFYSVTEKKKSAWSDLASGETADKQFAYAKASVENYEPTVSVSTKKSGDKVFVSVKDNGNGIPQKVLDKIFQPFFTTKPTGQGTGLGLSLSYDIIKAHGGELKVETKDGEGAEFIIQLPLI
jgi:signal transduction histidine kinase